MAKEINERHPIKIPDDIESINFSFMKEMFEGTFDDVESFVVRVLASIVGFTLLVLGQTAENLLNIVQFAKNTGAKKKIEFLQYCVGLYLFLESNNAVID